VAQGAQAWRFGQTLSPFRQMGPGRLVVGSCCFLLGLAKDTKLSLQLNALIAASSDGGVYTGGKGVLVRTPDGLSGPSVLPSTFWSNDITAPSQLYPAAGNPWCPHGSTDGYESLSWVDCGDAGSTGPWDHASVGFVIGTKMSGAFPDFDNIQETTWGNGVFYASDSNSVDGRCFFSEAENMYACPGGWIAMDGTFTADDGQQGAGYRPVGNPDIDPSLGGGAGCHFDGNSQQIDQPDAVDGDGQNLVQDYSCQCNYQFKTYPNGWGDWVKNWVSYNKQKSGFEWRTWFGQAKAPAWGADSAACWVNNPRDMINLQNALYAQRQIWNNQLVPTSSWDTGSSAEDRKYWGWNEVPADASFLTDPTNWDTVFVKLPGDICGSGGSTDTVGCLSDDAKVNLQQQLEALIDAGSLVPGADQVSSKPGSLVLFVREFRQTGNDGVWQRQFFCQEWALPDGNYHITRKGSTWWKMDTTVCLIEDGGKGYGFGYLDLDSSSERDALVNAV